MRALTDTERQSVRDLLAELVRIDSAVSSTAQANRDHTEARMADFLGPCVTRLGMTVERRDAYPGRPNVIAHWPEQTGDHSLTLSAHMDTVTTEGMTIEPFEPTVRDGRLYGRGSCDTKGAMAAMLTAITIAHEAGTLPADKLYFVATASEETGCDGAAALMKTGFRTDAAIVGEPTNCRLVTAHKGPIWLEVETVGQSCHASLPEKGRNAIEAMSRIVQYVQTTYAEHLAQNRHPLLGGSTAQVTLIDGGSKVNIIPALCRAQIDGRFIPGMSHDEIVADLRQRLVGHLGADVMFKLRVLTQQSSMDCPMSHPMVPRLLDLCRDANGQTTPEGVNYFADTGPFSKAGIASVLLGPGDIAQAHTADEFIELDQLYQATEIYLALLTDHAGRSIVA